LGEGRPSRVRQAPSPSGAVARAPSRVRRGLARAMRTCGPTLQGCLDIIVESERGVALGILDPVVAHLDEQEQVDAAISMIRARACACADRLDPVPLSPSTIAAAPADIDHLVDARLPSARSSQARSRPPNRQLVMQLQKHCSRVTSAAASVPARRRAGLGKQPSPAATDARCCFKSSTPSPVKPEIMKTRSKQPARTRVGLPRSRSRRTRSVLLSEDHRAPRVASRSTYSCVGSGGARRRPRARSIASAMRPAAATIASTRRGAKMPGVSTKISCAARGWRCRAAGCASSALG